MSQRRAHKHAKHQTRPPFGLPRPARFKPRNSAQSKGWTSDHGLIGRRRVIPEQRPSVLQNSALLVSDYFLWVHHMKHQVEMLRAVAPKRCADWACKQRALRRIGRVRLPLA